MARKLTIVVTCTERKTLSATPELRLGSVDGPDVQTRSDMWATRLRRSQAPRRTLRELYSGEAWSASLRLEAVARDMGYRPRMLVASAGLGLRDASTEAPSYGATFTPRQPDSAANSIEDRRTWWGRLCYLPDSSNLQEQQGPRLILVLSETYARAMRDDIRALASGRPAPEILMFGGSEDTPGVNRVPANRELLSHLGGTANGINARTAAAWLSRDKSGDFWSSALVRSWDRFTASVSKDESYDRLKVDDATIQIRIRELRRENPTISRSRALRHFRDSGIACEYSRFQSLFEAVTQ